MNPELRSIMLGFFIGVSVMSMVTIVAMLVKDTVVDTKVQEGIQAALSDYNIEVNNK